MITINGIGEVNTVRITPHIEDTDSDHPDAKWNVEAKYESNVPGVVGFDSWKVVKTCSSKEAANSYAKELKTLIDQNR